MRGGLWEREKVQGAGTLGGGQLWVLLLTHGSELPREAISLSLCLSLPSSAAQSR